MFTKGRFLSFFLLFCKQFHTLSKTVTKRNNNKMHRYCQNLKVICTFLFVFGLLLNTNHAFSFDKKAVNLYNEGMDLIFSGNTSGAIELFKESIETDPSFTESYKALADAYERAEDKQKAAETYESLLEKTPSDYESVYKTALFYHEMNNKEKTSYYLKKIPPEHSRYKDAKSLASSMEITLGFKPLSGNGLQKAIGEETVTTRNNHGKVIAENFTGPAGVAKDSKGNIYVADYTDNSIIQITRTGEKRVIFKGKPLNGPLGLAVDIFDNIYVANYNSDEILKISLKYNIGKVLFKNVKKPYYLTVDTEGNLFVTEQGSGALTKFKLR